MAVSVVLISAVDIIQTFLKKIIMGDLICCLVHDPKVIDASLCGNHCWVL
jgi:hypothetical protein